MQQSIVNLQTWGSGGSQKGSNIKHVSEENILVLQIAPPSAVECRTLLFQFRRCSAASFASVHASSSKVLCSKVSALSPGRPVVLSAIDSYLRSIHRDRDGSSLLASSLRRRCSARRTGNTKVLGKHSPFSCHFAAIKRPSSLLAPLPAPPLGRSFSHHRPSRLPPATVCYGYGLVLTEV